ncbi:hypothetical protein [Caulobacter sp. LjRoot300]|uniref:hypothetical protein n=1 Tax=Caulobacter sp. LjRoot300 TaxID=3342321 RepID=UPI003ECF0530
MAVIYYQLAILATLIFVRVAFPKRLLLAVLIWTGLTTINLFYPPLIIIQLAVIWGGYALLRSRSAPVVLPMPIATPRHTVPIAPRLEPSRADTESISQFKTGVTTEAMDAPNVWLIRNRHDHEQYWDGEAHRWDMLSLSTQGFTDAEKTEHGLPPAGEWVRDN